MRIDTPKVDLILHEDLNTTLYAMRSGSAFSPSEYLAKKVKLINEYFAAYNLCSGVVALSGGVDSSVVAGILKSCADVEGSPIKYLIGVCLPVHDVLAATGQVEATSRGAEVARHFSYELVDIDITKSHELLCESVDRAFGVVGEGWARGQAVAYQRTPTLYYVTSLLTEAGRPGVLCGTTNLDEGGYLGYFGKASDGLVDLQIISDLHKSEVYTMALYLGVPSSVLDVTPAGDMYDGRSDVEVFGTSYDFVELFTRLRRCSESEFANWTRDWSKESRAQYEELSGRLEKLHNFNGHKYLGASPAVHLDVADVRVPGGWKFQTWQVQK